MTGDHFTLIPTTHTVDSTLAAGVFIGRRMEHFTMTTQLAVARLFVTEFYVDPDRISLQAAWDNMLASDGEHGEMEALSRLVLRAQRR